MSELGKKFMCSTCGTKFYDFKKPEPLCPKCGTNQKTAPAKPKTTKKEKIIHVIEDDFTPEPEAESVEEPFADALAIDHGRTEVIDPGDLRMDDYDE